MLTEDEILDNQTQTLEEVMDKLVDGGSDVVEPNVVNDIDLSGALNIVVECFKASVDLHRTISNEGVSLADVQAMRAIQTRMEPFTRLPTKVALEEYDGMFTPTRSMINQTVSQEAVLSEIGRTLKEWFFIFVDFIIKVIHWCRRVLNSEDLIRAKLKSMDMNLQSMYNQLMNLIKYEESTGRNPYGDLSQLAEVVLSDPKLTRSESMLVAFNVKDADKHIIAADKDIDRNVNLLMKDVVSLKSHIEQNKPMSIGVDYGMEINVTADSLEDMTVAMDDASFFFDAVGTSFWTKPKQLAIRQIFAPSHNINQVQRLGKEIRSIKRNSNFNELKEVDAIVQAVENLSSSVKGLERVIKFKQSLYTDYYKASATYANFYIRAREHVYASIHANLGSDINHKLMESLSKTWEATLDRMGI